MSRSVLYTSSPLLASKTPVWRSKFIVAMIALGFAGLAARAAYVQVFGNAFFQRQGEVRFARTLELPANRGKILDRNGLILASSVPAASIWAIPEDVEQDKPEVRAKLKQLARLLGMSQAELNARLADEDKSFVWVKRQLDWDVGQQIAALDIKGIYQRKEYKRQYPEGESAAHVVGFTNVEDKGQEGMELAFNSELAGRAGSRRVIKDRLGRGGEGVGETVPPVDGRDMQLSIDSKVQFFAYQKLRDQVAAHKAKAGSVVVLDAHTGELLALANYPSYVPDKRQNLTGEQLRNRALTDVFEPGSTMKPFTIGLALESGRMRPDTVIDTTPGRLTITGSTISDTHNYGALTVEGVIQKSSNVGTTKIAMQIPAREMWETFSAAGFGQKPQLAFPGVVSGRLRPYKTWRPIEQATMSYGYGLSASLFQITRAYSVFARDGMLMPVSLVREGAADTSGKFHPTDSSTGVRVYRPDVAKDVMRMLHLVTSPGGTAQQAQTSGYSVGGKSGTARKQVGKNYSENHYRASFVGVAPIETPRVVVGVMIDEPQGSIYGGAVAAPVFSEVVQQTLRLLGVAPDMSVQPGVVIDAAQESL